MSSSEQHDGHKLRMGQNSLLALHRPKYSVRDTHAGKILIGPSQKLSKVYFPIKGLLSAVHIMGDGTRIEVGLVGAEGFAPIGLAFGKPFWPYAVEVRTTGTVAEMPLRDFTKALDQNTVFRKAAYKFIDDFIDQSLCSSACGVRHNVEQRLARWLLMAHDRLHKDDIAITQIMLGELLGIGRQAVNATLRALHDRGAVDVRRSRIRLVSRRKLQNASCECYDRRSLT